MAEHQASRYDYQGGIEGAEGGNPGGNAAPGEVLRRDAERLAKAESELEQKQMMAEATAYLRGLREGLSRVPEVYSGLQDCGDGSQEELEFLRGRVAEMDRVMGRAYMRDRVLEHVNVARGMLEAGGNTGQVLTHILNAIERLTERD